jgi:uncharacterized membrane protein
MVRSIKTARLGPLALAATACLLSGTALADPPGAPARVSVTSDAHGASGDVRASIEIAASPAVVWKVMTDCAAVPRLMVNVRSCRVIDRDPAGRWDVREQITNASLLPAVRTVLRSDYDYPRTVRFHRIDGDFKILEGSWLLEPLDGGAHTRVTYESRMTAPFAAPGFIVRAVLRKDLPRTLGNLRAACEARQGAGPRLAARP